MQAESSVGKRTMVSVNVPIFNEARNIEPLYREILAALQNTNFDFELVFVNDGSDDGSRQELDRLAESDHRVKVIHLRRNCGQTAALMAAIKHSRGDVIIPIDGDCQNDPADIPRLIERLYDGYDLVAGWRKDRKDRRLTRRLPSRVANNLISTIFGVRLHDYGCTLKAIRRTAIEEVRLYGEMHRYIPIYVAWRGARVTELQVNHRPRLSGESKYGLSRIWRVILDLFLIRYLERALDRPIQFFGKIGLWFLAFALVTGGVAVWLRVAGGISFIQTPLPLAVVMFATTGFLCLLMGLLAEMLTRIYFDSPDRPPYSIESVRNI